MAIITISRGSYSKGKEVAEKVAQRLGYQCVVREAVIEASKEFNIPEVKLVRAINNAPSILDRFTHGKEKYVAYIRAALLKLLKQDNVIYHGLAGHFFLKGVTHALKVRINADMEDRVRNEMERENVSAEEALRVLKSDDEERRKWSHNLYGIDTADPSLYDLIIHIKDINIDSAVEIICHTVSLERFQTTEASKRAIEDMALGAEVKATLIHIKPDVDVTANNGFVHVETRVPIDEQMDLIEDIERLVKAIPGVKGVDVKASPRVKRTDGRLFP